MICVSFIKFKIILQVKKKNSTVHQKHVSFYKNHWSGKNISSLNSILGKDFESEGKDRYNMELPGKQLTLLQDAVKYGKCSFSITILMLENTEGTIKNGQSRETGNI
jgi:hypothetical protein